MRVLNEGTELDDPLELSVQERMNLSVKNHVWLLRTTLAVTGFILILGLLIILAQQFEYEEQYTDIQAIACVLCLVSGLFVCWGAIRGRKQHSESLNIIREYTHQSYLVTLSATNRTDGDISTNFFNDVARNVFPELKLADIESMKKDGEEVEIEELTLEDKKDGDYTFDVVYNHDKIVFLIKDFKKNKVSYDDLKECLDVATNEFGKNKIYRLVFLAEDFDSNILKNYQKLSSKAPPLDLIYYNEKGFMTLKISNVISELSDQD